ncbi:MAG: SAM-dependent methyltransferase, partial [Deltaproteobacteria bacterium]|nr:SAM-dependent methyltransferase [Deltaproteobacteria bacterium]
MNLRALNRFAVETRIDLKQQITRRLETVLSADTAELRGRQKAIASLKQRIDASSKEQVVDEIAYTWFNRFAALRILDARDFHPFRARVLTPLPGETLPELFQHVRVGRVPQELSNFDRSRFQNLLSGKIPSANPQAAAYRLLLVAVCNYWHLAMGFLFEPIDDETELLLPDDLLTPASVAEGFRTEISDEDCSDIEIIGWLYQFYISEKKDQVIGKVVKSEDIPAATQLFTPNWIVKYMVQNSLGAQWLATYPQSPLKGQMEYYIEPAEQTDEVNAQLAAITPSQLNPEELTLIDPASGSGHILVEAYELFKAIYLERGYRQRDVAQLILEKNLFGLEICPRAAQLTGFALMMKGRADDRRLFERGV